ncbi:hypothetical protein B1756_00580 [Natrarchaeobaculum aegyptiacum]|uniref:Uncharacterized protein n=1 Tax=Natrarchaeobaculum aegyptiacum TaxID=745377 RepID=A0A2Z2HTK5_9EURY|nr:hypothetical protein B1756_00580 [Natrarchaeobaculum aegyptiacum]
MVRVTTSETTSDGLSLFDSPFNIASTIVGVIALVAAPVFLWTGYQDSTLPVVGTELNILNGSIGFMLLALVAVTAFVMAAFMESGFGR